jgi:type III pantothenate kinase
MNLCIDQGNSSTKIGIFDQDKLIESCVLEKFEANEVSEIFAQFPINACIVSSVIHENEKLLDDLSRRCNHFIVLSHLTPVPIVNEYKTPETLGRDRLAVVVGASFLNPEHDILVVDAGTAITYDFIDSNKVYWGGNIAPGLTLRLRALHEFTQRLPLVEPQIDSPILGNDTQSALVSGALHGIVYEIDGYINTLKIKYPKLSVFLTGGSIFYFDTKLKSAIFAERNLVLIGLNRILQYNVQK